ncbi:MAG: patatin-like phospholipase family protein, partial [Candidatus Sericytochromatia bacterium]|nr:patatin-like phospholipase family protein [Candidatus Tanganyikabacteria bacterium]
NRRIPALFLVKGHRGFTFQTGIVDEAQPNARLNDALLRGNLLARGRFDQLPIPFHAVATDLRNRKTVVLDTGDLARAVRASSSIPLVFPPVVAGEAVLVDGGLSANIPVAEARQLGAARVIVSDVTEYPRDTLDFESPLALADQLLGFLFQQTTAERRRGDIWIRPDVQSYRSLDFSPETIATILRRGELAADSTIGRAACLPQRIRNESDFPATTGPWQVTTADRRDSLLLARHLGLSRQGRLDETALRRGLLALAEAEAVRGVWLNPGGRGDSVTLSLEPLTAPVSVGGLGLAYDHELGGRAWAGWFDRRALGTPAEASVLLTLGRYQRELVVAGLAHVDPGMSRLTPIVTVHLLAEDVRQFDDAGIETRAAATREGRVAAGVEFRPGIAWRIRLQAEAIRWSEPGASSSVLGGSLETSARSRGGKSITMEALWAGASARFRVAGEAPMIRTGRTTTVASGRLGWGRALPLRWTLPLGGDAGFPGLHLGERRGFAETMAAVRFGYRAIGPLEARVFAAAGRVWTDARSPGPWLGGAR